MQKNPDLANENRSASNETPVALTIAGSDSGGGAGIQVDLRTFSALGVYGTCAITCLTAQNPNGVSMVEAVEEDMIEAQLAQVSDYFAVGALKTGMLFSEKIIVTVARFIADHPDIPAVVDPVMVASSGAVLLEANAIEALKGSLLPKAAIITPNLDEARVLLGTRPSDLSQMKEAAMEISRRFGTAVLLKGGHLETDILTDVLYKAENGMTLLTSKRNQTIDTHGSGCTLAAAIAASLARGFELQAAVVAAHAYLKASIAAPLRVGSRDYINHLAAGK